MTKKEEKTIGTTARLAAKSHDMILARRLKLMVIKSVIPFWHFRKRWELRKEIKAIDEAHEMIHKVMEIPKEKLGKFDNMTAAFEKVMKEKEESQEKKK